VQAVKSDSIVYLNFYTMSGRGDNNKNGSSGRGAGNQSNQPFVNEEKVKKSYRGDETGGQPSEQQPKQQDQSSNRNTSTEGNESRR
jgi:hypothetical protein